MNQEVIGKYIQQKRKELNMTQKELADKLRVSDKTVSKWERGINLPDMSLFDDLCNILNVSLVEFLQGKDIEESKQIEHVEHELKKSLIKQTKTEKVIEFISLFFIGFGFCLLFLTAIFNNPKELLSDSYVFCFIVSSIGFILLMYLSKKGILKKLLYTFIYIISFQLVLAILLIINYTFIFTSNFTCYESCYEMAAARDNLEDYDTFIEKGYINNVYENLVIKKGYVIDTWVMPGVEMTFLYDDNYNFKKFYFGYQDSYDKDFGITEEVNLIDYLKGLKEKELYRYEFINSEDFVYVYIYETKNNYVINNSGQVILKSKKESTIEDVIEYSKSFFEKTTIYYKIYDVKNDTYLE